MSVTWFCEGVSRVVSLNPHVARAYVLVVVDVIVLVVEVSVVTGLGHLSLQLPEGGGVVSTPPAGSSPVSGTLSQQ